jgi:hypothetical protein
MLGRDPGVELMAVMDVLEPAGGMIIEAEYGENT